MKNEALENFENKKIQDWESALSGILNENRPSIPEITRKDYLNPIKNPHIQAALKFLLKEISDKQRAIIEMIFVDGKKQIQVAKELGLSNAAISRLKERAFKQLGKGLVYSSFEVNLFEKVCVERSIKNVNNVNIARSKTIDRRN